MKDRNCETDSGIRAMTVAGKFTMTRIEILAVSLNAAKYADDPNGSPAFQLRSLLGV